MAIQGVFNDASYTQTYYTNQKKVVVNKQAKAFDGAIST